MKVNGKNAILYKAVHKKNDMALLECEVPVKNIIVCKDTDGKVRTSKLKVLREVPKEEW